jgi:tetratricopeptide (TPR) repeat protein
LLLAKMGEYDKAERIYTILFDLTRDDDLRMFAHLNNQLGYIKKQKGDLPGAIVCYQKALEIQQTILPHPHLDLATTYSNIGSAHHSLGENKLALSFYREVLAMKLEFLPSDDPSLAITYSSIVSAHDSMGDYPTALSFYKKALHIQQKSLPPNHPSLATTFNNIARIYRLSEDYPTALSFYLKSLEIKKNRCLPTIHRFQRRLITSPTYINLYENTTLHFHSLEKHSL